MSVNIEVAIREMQVLRTKGVRYSMYGSRTGTDGTADCSGAIYACLRKAGASNAGWVLNTDSMHGWLEKNGFQLIAQNKEWTAKRGDIVIFGRKGASGGAAGHVVLFINNTQIIHCNYARNGVSIDNEATTCPYSMRWYVYRQKTISSTPLSTGWIAEKGHFKLNAAIKLRKGPSTNDGEIATISAGSVIIYDAYKIDPNGYVWIRQKRGDGYGYMATGRSKNGRRIDCWGRFY
ncbi:MULTISPECIES: peptidoglycan amidohydrolase family protein [Enterococcus]|uniref:NlpC/P60 domain-containing protein n=2 Tax=Enterococcus TaxID=1350 RepID=A0A6A8NGE7_ENTFC|nr:peptidoglycan amidohydrolase family protein [Enterococcus faecium]MBD9707664.1 C40 family peptidase [Enterococcus faecium]MTD23363.1 hypothetical protein [Enterococcus faecium]MTD35069.1 hypothetical protein [Enterococcus faecium]